MLAMSALDLKDKRVLIREDLNVPLADGKISNDDGILVEYDDWWFSLRKSNTEPVMRLIVEAQNEELLDRKVSELDALLKR